MKVRSLFIASAFLLTLLAPPLATSFADSGSKSNDRIIDGKSNSRDSHKGVYSPVKRKSESMDGQMDGQSDASSAASLGTLAAGQGAVTYHKGGSIIANPRVYVIWYGDWGKNSCTPEDGRKSTASILMDLVKNIGGSRWNSINATYYQRINGQKVSVSEDIDYGGCVVDTGSLGFTLDGVTGATVADVVDAQLQQGKLRADPSGVYLVLTATNVNVNGFLTLFCGYHDYYSLPSMDIKYSLIGDPSLNMSGCVSQLDVSPNGNPAADGMASVLAHELVEPISDPLLDAWFDELGFENADKCAFRYGQVTRAADGSYSNMQIGDRRFLIQQNVAANSNMCVSSLRRS